MKSVGMCFLHTPRVIAVFWERRVFHFISSALVHARISLSWSDRLLWTVGKGAGQTGPLQRHIYAEPTGHSCRDATHWDHQSVLHMELHLQPAQLSAAVLWVWQGQFSLPLSFAAKGSSWRSYPVHMQLDMSHSPKKPSCGPVAAWPLSEVKMMF